MNQKTVTWLAVITAVAMAAVGIKLAVDSRRPRGTDSQQIQTMIRAGVEAADRRDGPTIGRMISSDYRDSLGMSDASVRYQIHDFFRRQTSVQVSVPERTLQIEVAPDGKSAIARFHATVVSQGANGTATTEVDPVLKLAKERVYYYWMFPGEEWRITSSENYGGLEGL